jgi:NlpC/P60 family protein/dipeptidyl peptidase-like protein
MPPGRRQVRGPGALDPRLNAYRDDLADARLRGKIGARRFVEGQRARVVVGRAAVRRRPEPQGEIDTFYHYGEEVLVFAEAGGHAWCQSLCDFYVGYVAAGDIAIGPPPAPSHCIATPGSYCYDVPDLRTAARDFLPRHSAVVVAEASLMRRGTQYARLDTGCFLPFACLSREPPRSASLVAAASLYLGVPYLWGGKSFLGLDCSGLVQSAFRDLGIAVPRDTDMQQEAIGSAVLIEWAGDLRPGDLLFLPGHVMIYAGDGAVIHADGVSMRVRRDNLAALLHERNLDLASFVVRRP